jgi:hypothetical protein
MTSRERIHVAAVVVSGLAARVVYLILLRHLLHADEAIFGLMAREIGAGREFPLLFWDAHYGGTLLSFLAALPVTLFGPSPTALRAATLPLTALAIVAAYWVAREGWGHRAGLAGSTWIALGPPLLFERGSRGFGGYPETLLFGLLIAVLTLGLTRTSSPPAAVARRLALLGCVAGFDAYSNILGLPLGLAALLHLRREWGRLTAREIAPATGGFLLGVTPLIAYNLMHPGATVLRLGSRVLGISRGDLSSAAGGHATILARGLEYLMRVGTFPGDLTRNAVGLVGPAPLPINLALASVIGWGVALAAGILLWKDRAGVGKRPGGDGGLRLAALLGCALVLSLWGADLRAPRHAFALYVVAPLLVGWGWHRLEARPRFALVALGALVAVHAVGHAFTPTDSREDLRPLIASLDASGDRFLFTDYFIAYPVAYLTGGRITASPAAGPVNVDRRPAYTVAVSRAARPAYAFETGTPAAATFGAALERVGLAATRQRAGAFEIHRPGRRVLPWDLPLIREFPQTPLHE